ncbi:hypothetical protein HOA59_02320 [archaeon]|jgi:hypothetical protein|nr:hypothetical protein [archaeon]MBT6824249.1 hypothetical protein [archaeon]MBT7106815.1 hypothetical protein [archaeon]MBT7297514.1 hypothetical protein [archaeon]
MVNKLSDLVIFENLSSCIDCLEKKGYDRNLLEQVAESSGGEYVTFNESRRKKSVLKHLGLTFAGAGVVGVATYLATDIILDDFQRVAGCTSMASTFGAFTVFETYKGIVESANDKARQGLLKYLRKDL